MKIKQSTISELQWKIHFMKVDYLKSIFMSIQAKTYFQIVISIRERYFLLMNHESVHDIQEQHEILAKTSMLHTNFCAYLAELSFSISVFALFVCNAYLTTKQRVLVYWNCRFEKVKKKNTWITDYASRETFFEANHSQRLADRSQPFISIGQDNLPFSQLLRWVMPSYCNLPFIQWALQIKRLSLDTDL